MLFKPFDDITDVLHIWYPITKFFGLAPFERVKLKNGKYICKEKSFKYLPCSVAVLVNLIGVTMQLINIFEASNSLSMEVYVLLALVASCPISNAITMFYVTYHISDLFKLFEAVNRVDQIMKLLQITVGFKSLNIFHLACVGALLSVWIINLFVISFTSTFREGFVQVTTFGLSINTQALTIVYFIYFCFAISRRLKYLNDCVKLINDSDSSSLRIQQYIVDFSNAIQTIKKLVYYNVRIFSIGVLMLYLSANLSLLGAIIDLKFIHSTNGSLALITGTICNIVVILIVVLVEIIKIRYKKTVRSLDNLVTSYFSTNDILLRKNTLLLQTIHEEVNFMLLGLFDLTFQKILEGFGFLTSIVMFLNQVSTM